MEEENEVVIVTNVYGDFCIRKERRKRQKLLIQELFYDYANNTTLHGLPYITKRGVSMVEKIFWLITFIASVSMCLYLISKVWFKWEASPVIVTVNEHLVPVGKVPFPSVTICPQSKSKVSAYNYTAEKMKVDLLLSKIDATLNETMKKQLTKFAAVSQVCGNYFANDLTYELYAENFTGKVLVDHLLEVAPSYSDFFAVCGIRGRQVKCHELFSEIVTSEGICYNMNSLAASEIFRPKPVQMDYPYLYANTSSRGWSMEGGYINSDSFNKSLYYPLPGAENGASPDVEITLMENMTDRDQLCNGINSGYKVYLHHPADLPQSSLYYYAVLHNQVSSMALSFSVLSTSNSLEEYDPEILQCYFPAKRHLKYFKQYTASNCRIECLSNMTFKICKCVEFYMPHDDSKSICTAQDMACVAEARDKVLEQESDKDSAVCHCLPSCNSATDYEAEILKTEYNIKQFNKVYLSTFNYSDHEWDGHNFSKLEMYFKKPRYVSMRRSELFGLTDFLANCGGLLGLFLGFSFLSLVEIFYFLTLRLYRTLKKDLEEEKATKEKEGQTEKF